MTTPPRRPSSASRAPRRSRRTGAGSTPFIQRNRTRILWIAGLVGFLLLGTAFYANASRPTYTCTEMFNPTAAPSVLAPSAAASATPTEAPATPRPSGSTSPTLPPVTPAPPGYVQPDQGAGHVDPGTTVRYATCPPASGKHYNGSGVGPIRGGFYGMNETAVPPGWVHNLEHGYIVLLYSCTAPGSDQAAGPCTDTGQQAMRDMLTRWPNSPYCGTPPGQITPVIARFDDMAWPYAAIVWDVVLPLQTLDEAAVFDFYAERGERYNPEALCADPTPTPGPTPTAGPSATPGASGAASPAPSGAASPGASPAASPIASPAASTAPSPS